MKREDLSILDAKLKTVNHILMNPSDDLSATSISIGVAFSEHGFPDELFSQADQALYYIKEHGRRGYHVWDANEKQ